MDKKLILSVAGSGKTSYIINNLNEEERFLIITYTNGNTKNIKEKVIKKFGYIPQNVTIQTYHKFIFSFCIMPFLGYTKKIKGLYFNNYRDLPKKKLEDEERYMTKQRKLYSDRLAQYIKQEKMIPEVLQRIEKYYDSFYIDEVQDFAGHDFDFLLELTNVRIKMEMVGDFNQHTYKTSVDGNKNINLFSSYENYKTRFTNKNIIIDEKTLEKSFRVSEEVCSFLVKNLGLSIESHKKVEGKIELIENNEDITKIIERNDIIKLFYKNSSKYKCYSQNWGDSKGIDKYDEVCVILNPKTMTLYKSNELIKLVSETKSKFYVACTRARSKLYFIEQAKIKKFLKSDYQK